MPRASSVRRESQTPSSRGGTQSDAKDDPVTPPKRVSTPPTLSPRPTPPPATMRSPPPPPKKCAQSSPLADSAPIQTLSPPYHSPKVFRYRETAPPHTKDLHPPPDTAGPKPAPPATSAWCDPSILPVSRDDFFWPRPPASTSPHTFAKPSDRPNAA